MWRVYRAIEGIFNIKSKRHCGCRGTQKGTQIIRVPFAKKFKFLQELKKELKLFHLFQRNSKKNLKYLSFFLNSLNKILDSCINFKKVVEY